MSTNINISVGDNKLLGQARLQQNASRQAQLEKETNKRLEAQATDARAKALASKGLDANGNPIAGLPLTQPQLNRRPAASRSAGVGMLLVPNPLLEFENTLRIISGGRSTQLYFDPGYYLTPQYNAFTFLDDVGPNNADAAGYGATTVSASSAVGGFILSTGRAGDPNLADYSEDDLLFSTLTSIPGYVSYTVQPSITQKQKISSVSSWTAESWIRAGLGVGLQNTSTNSTISGPGFIFDFGVGYQANTPGDPYGNGVYSLSSLRINGVDYSAPPNMGKSVYPPANSLYSSHTEWEVSVADSRWVGRGDPEQIVPDVVVPDIDYGSWHHFAAVYANSQYKFYFNGSLICSIAVPLLSQTAGKFFSNSTWYVIPWGELPIRLGAFLDPPNEYSVDGGPGAIHGLRFTPRALYSANFTPPPTITSIA